MLMYVMTQIPFFHAYDKVSVDGVCRCFKLREYEAGDVVFNEGDDADEMYFVIKGQVGVYLGTDNGCVRILGCADMFGERALQTDKKRRDSTLKAHEHTYCLALDRKDFQDRVFFFANNQKLKRLHYIKNLNFTENWSHEKISLFNTEVGQRSLVPGEVLFEIDSPAEVLFIVKSGVVTVEVIVEISEENKYPTGDYEWEVCTKRRQIQYQVH